MDDEASERDTVPIKFILLAVGFGDPTLGRLRSIGGGFGARIASCSFAEAAASARALLPQVLLVAPDPRVEAALGPVATEISAKLIVLGPDEDRDDRIQHIFEGLVPR